MDREWYDFFIFDSYSNLLYAIFYGLGFILVIFVEFIVFRNGIYIVFLSGYGYLFWNVTVS